MIRRQQRYTIRHLVSLGMAEHQTSLVAEQPNAFRVRKISIEGDLAQRHYHLHLLQDSQLAVEIRGTIRQLGGKRLVVGWGATNRGSNVTVDHLETIVSVVGIGLGGESNLIKDGIHEFARGISRERASSTVGTVRTRGQSQDQDPSRGVSEARHRTCPVIMIAVGTTLFAPDLLPISDQPWTLCARNNFVVENCDLGRHGSYCKVQLRIFFTGGNWGRSSPSLPALL